MRTEETGGGQHGYAPPVEDTGARNLRRRIPAREFFEGGVARNDFSDFPGSSCDGIDENLRLCPNASECPFFWSTRPFLSVYRNSTRGSKLLSEERRKTNSTNLAAPRDLEDAGKVLESMRTPRVQKLLQALEARLLIGESAVRKECLEDVCLLVQGDALDAGTSANRKYKTSICPLLKAGKCTRQAEDCKYAHSLGELRATKEFFKTAICRFWVGGSCKLGCYCRHAHGEWELQERPITEAAPLESQTPRKKARRRRNKGNKSAESLNPLPLKSYEGGIGVSENTCASAAVAHSPKCCEGTNVGGGTARPADQRRSTDARLRNAPPLLPPWTLRRAASEVILDAAIITDTGSEKEEKLVEFFTEEGEMSGYDDAVTAEAFEEACTGDLRGRSSGSKQIVGAAHKAMAARLVVGSEPAYPNAQSFESDCLSLSLKSHSTGNSEAQQHEDSGERQLASGSVHLRLPVLPAAAYSPAVGGTSFCYPSGYEVGKVHFSGNSFGTGATVAYSKMQTVPVTTTGGWSQLLASNSSHAVSTEQAAAVIPQFSVLPQQLADPRQLLYAWPQSAPSANQMSPWCVDHVNPQGCSSWAFQAYGCKQPLTPAATPCGAPVLNGSFSDGAYVPQVYNSTGSGTSQAPVVSSLNSWVTQFACPVHQVAMIPRLSEISNNNVAFCTDAVTASFSAPANAATT